MPTYPYHCNTCHQECEAFQKITDVPLTRCPNCGSESLKRGIGGGNAVFQFQGNGFYKTDYKSPSSGQTTHCCPCGKDKGNCQ